MIGWDKRIWLKPSFIDLDGIHHCVNGWPQRNWFWYSLSVLYVLTCTGQPKLPPPPPPPIHRFFFLSRLYSQYATTTITCFQTSQNNLCGVVANVLHYNVIASEFKHQRQHYGHFWTYTFENARNRLISSK